MMRATSLLCGIVASGLIGYAGYQYARERHLSSGGTLIVPEPDRDLGQQPCGQPVSVSFRIYNTSAQPVRIVGLVPG
jgi:hypothetical protein